MGLNTIAEISHKYGSDDRYVLAGGGNTSYKNEENLEKKHSGCDSYGGCFAIFLLYEKEFDRHL